MLARAGAAPARPAGEGDTAVGVVKGTAAGDPGTVDVAPIMHALALDMVCDTLFCERLGALQSEADGTSDAVVMAFRFAENEMVRRTSSMNPLDFLYWPWLGAISTAQREWDRSQDVIQRRVGDVILRRLDKGIDDGDNDLLFHMVGERWRPSKPLPDGVLDNIITMMWVPN